MEATLGNRVEGEAQAQLAARLAPDIQRQSATAAYIYRVAGLHEDAIRVARAWAETFEELPPGISSVLYHLVLDEEEQALDALVRHIENPGVFLLPTTFVIANAFDDPTLEKPEFQARRAEFRAKVGWN